MKQDNKKLYESIMSTVAKEVKKALNESRSDDGWDENELYELIEVLDDIYNLSYEVKNCVRGAYTNANTYEELADHIEDLAARLEEQAGYVRQIPEPEEDYNNIDESLNENWFHDLVGSGKAMYLVLIDYIKKCLKQIAESNESYNINPYNVRYDKAKGIIFYKDFESCQWGPIHELKNGIIIENIKEGKMCGNDKECQKAIEIFNAYSKGGFGQELLSQMKSDKNKAQSNAEWMEKRKNDPEVKYRNCADEYGGFELMKKNLGSAKQYYHIFYNHKTYYFARRDAAEDFAKLTGEGSQSIHVTNI